MVATVEMGMKKKFLKEEPLRIDLKKAGNQKHQETSLD